MDNREQRVRERIKELEAEIDQLTSALEAKRADCQRYRNALDVWLSVDVDLAPVQQPKRPETKWEADMRRYQGMKFLDAVRTILTSHGEQPTYFIYEALLEGGFETESDNFRGVVSNMLNEAAKAGKLVKRGERLNAAWSLPESEPGAKVASLYNFQPGDQPGE